MYNKFKQKSVMTALHRATLNLKRVAPQYAAGYDEV